MTQRSSNFRDAFRRVRDKIRVQDTSTNVKEDDHLSTPLLSKKLDFPLDTSNLAQSSPFETALLLRRLEEEMESHRKALLLNQSLKAEQEDLRRNVAEEVCALETEAILKQESLLRTLVELTEAQEKVAAELQEEKRRTSLLTQQLKKITVSHQQVCLRCETVERQLQVLQKKLESENNRIQPDLRLFELLRTQLHDLRVSEMVSLKENPLKDDEELRHLVEGPDSSGEDEYFLALTSIEDAEGPEEVLTEVAEREEAKKSNSSEESVDVTDYQQVSPCHELLHVKIEASELLSIEEESEAEVLPSILTPEMIDKPSPLEDPDSRTSQQNLSAAEKFETLPEHQP